MTRHPPRVTVRVSVPGLEGRGELGQETSLLLVGEAPTRHAPARPAPEAEHVSRGRAHSPRAGEAATAPGVALAARQRPLPTSVAGEGGARPVNRRSQGKGDRLAAMTAPGARRAYRKRAGHETTPSGRARNPLKSVGQAATSAPIAAPGHDKRPAPKRATTPTRARGHSKSHRGHSPGQQAKPPGPRRAATPNNAKRTPAGGKTPTRGKGPAESPGAPSPASPPTRSPLQKVLDDAHRLIPRPR